MPISSFYSINRPAFAANTHDNNTPALRVFLSKNLVKPCRIRKDQREHQNRTFSPETTSEVCVINGAFDFSETSFGIIWGCGAGR
jgi:hypothetical protein